MAGKKNSPDIQESQKDKEHLKRDEATINLPDVKDIPGQENIRVPKLREMKDTTASSADEEGEGLWNEEGEEDITSENFGPARVIDENELRINSERKLERKLDTQDVSGEADEATLTNVSADPDADVTPDEVEGLERTENMDTNDNENLLRAELDDTDFEGEKLNENIGVSGEDLDVPGADLDDSDEEIGEEDEENNLYSLGDNE